MFDRILNFLGTITPGDADLDADFSPDDSSLSAAALMFHVIQADGLLRQVEQDRFKSLVQAENALEGKALAKLLDAAKKADAEAVDLYKFTSVLNRKLEEPARVHFIELLWELVYSDGVRHELEDNVVWRISELLGVSTRDRVEMRMRVEDRMTGIEKN